MDHALTQDLARLLEIDGAERRNERELHQSLQRLEVLADSRSGTPCEFVPETGAVWMVTATG